MNALTHVIVPNLYTNNEQPGHGLSDVVPYTSEWRCLLTHLCVYWFCKMCIMTVARANPQSLQTSFVLLSIRTAFCRVSVLELSQLRLRIYYIAKMIGVVLITLHCIFVCILTTSYMVVNILAAMHELSASIGGLHIYICMYNPWQHSCYHACSETRDCNI